MILEALVDWLRDPWRSEDFQRMHRRAQAAESRANKLRAALEESWLYEMMWSQMEDGYDVGGSDGWECASCFDEPERPVFETKEDVTHRPTCPLYVPRPVRSTDREVGK